jgi:hypothetical protein
MNDQGTPEGNLGGTLFLKPCATCGGLAELVNGLAPGDDRVCVGCLQEQIQERKLAQLQQPKPAARRYEPSVWKAERLQEDES